MKSLTNWRNQIQWIGRTLEIGEKIYFDWTNSGFRVSFTGSLLIVRLEALCETDSGASELYGKYWPYAAVFYDDSPEPHHIFEIKPPMKEYLLFASKDRETHVITVRKMTENAKGKIACCGFTGDGFIEKAACKSDRLRIDFIGDSITCGFGNMSDERDRGFYPAEENGWLTYGAEAGRLLSADINMISCSGISLMDSTDAEVWNLPGMRKIFEYTDWFLEEKLGREKKTRWDFKTHPRDIAVINLGTNDSVMLDIFMGNMNEQRFEEEYRKFLCDLRRVYGEKTWILCTLGPLDYFLYENIKRVIQDYASESEDGRVRCFKFMKVRMSEGIGASNHPTVKTHLRMGRELAEFIRALPKEIEGTD